MNIDNDYRLQNKQCKHKRIKRCKVASKGYNFFSFKIDFQKQFIDWFRAHQGRAPHLLFFHFPVILRNILPKLSTPSPLISFKLRPDAWYSLWENVLKCIAPFLDSPLTSYSSWKKNCVIILQNLYALVEIRIWTDILRVFYVLICIVFVVGLIVRLFVGLFLVRHILYRFNIVQH